MEKEWIAMFSQTGSEIASLAEHIGKFPNVIITNNSDKTTWCKELQELDQHRRKGRIVIVTPTQAKTCNFIHNIQGSKNSLITLHGWLRIVPADICEQYEIVNGHPGLITKFPDLKGKDPQVRAYDKGYTTIGSVVHEVTAEVDEGDILEVSETFQDEFDNLDDVFVKFKHTSYSAWVKFFDKQ